MVQVRICVDCSNPIGKWVIRCDGCRRIHRRESAKRWPSRPACASCGSPKTSQRVLCRKCSAEQRRTLVPCQRCGVPFWPWANGADHARKTCGCKPQPRPVKKVGKPKETRICSWCLEPFEAFNGKRHGMCSTVCRQRFESKRRKLRIRGMEPRPVSAVALYRRRGNPPCGICGLPIDPALKYPHPFSVTVDHVVPLTRGGTHHDSNLQPAHARCNTSKGNRHGDAEGGRLSFPSAFQHQRVNAEIGRAHV